MPVRFSTVCGALGVAIVMGLLTPARGHAGECPYRGWRGDGCPGAGGSFFIAPYFHATSFYVFAAQSGQNWAGGPHPWTWNSPGVDYGIGPPAGLRLRDPAMARLPDGCVYLAAGSLAHGALVRCGRGAVNPVLSGLDFSLHGCTVFEADSYVAGVVTLANSRFRNGPNCSIRFGYLIKIISGEAGLTLDNDLIDEAYPEFTTPLVAAVVVNTGTSALTVKRTAILNASSRPMSGTSSGPIDVEDSVFVGMTLASFANTGQHGELFEMGSRTIGVTYPSIVYRNIVVVIPGTTAMTITAPFYPNGLRDKQHVIDRFVADHNVVVTNYAGGRSATVASDIDGWVEGNTLHVDKGFLGAISVGSSIVGLPAFGRATILRRIDENSFALSGTPPPGRFAHANTLRATTAAALAELTLAKTYRDAQITSNYVDPTGALSCIQMLYSHADSLTISDNRSLVTSEAIKNLGYRAQGASCPPLF